MPTQACSVNPDSTSEVDSTAVPPLSRWLDFPNVFATAIFASLVTLATLNLGKANLAVLAMMGLSASDYLFHQGKRAKEILFFTHVKESSRWQHFRVGHLFIGLIALGFGFVLAVSLVVFLLTVHWVVLASVIAVQLFFLPLRGWFLNRLKPHVKFNSRMAFANFSTVLTLGVISVVVLVAAKWIEMKWGIPDMVIGNVDYMAERVSARIEYDIIWVQHLARTLSMFELELLSAHHFAEGWVGHVILIYFLLPSTVAAFALPVIYAGLSMACRGEKVVSGREHRE